MKNIQKLNNDRGWVEPNKTAATPAQVAAVLAGDADTIAALSTNRSTAVGADVSSKADSILQSKLDPKMTEFISCDMTIDGDKSWGIINYRINNDHKQIRF